MIKTKNTLKSRILTLKEQNVINKKLSGAKLTQQDSNYLSRYIRPKLNEIKTINAKHLLDRLTYNQKAISIENKIKKLILKNLRQVDSITIYGSAIQTSYQEYKDIDVLVITKTKFWKKMSEKYKKILQLKQEAGGQLINLDLEIYDKATFQKSYPSNPSLVYQLKDRKIIYGKLNLPHKLQIPKLDLRMKLDYSILDKNPKTVEIYKAIRNLILINLILRKIIDNKKLIEDVNKEIGENLAKQLKTETISPLEKKIALLHLQRLLNSTLRKIEDEKWEKIVLSNH